MLVSDVSPLQKRRWLESGWYHEGLYASRPVGDEWRFLLLTYPPDPFSIWGRGMRERKGVTV